MELCFFGTDACMCAPDNDSSGILINCSVLVDTGYRCVERLGSLGIEPESVNTLIFTHLHHDHYLSLPQFLFWKLQKSIPLSSLHIYGPRDDLRRVVNLSLAFLQAGKGQPFYTDAEYPTLHELAPGDTFKIAANEHSSALTVTTCASYHPVAGLCYRFTETATGKTLGITGDTFYQPDIAPFMRNVDLLVHECAAMCSLLDRNMPPPYLHSNIDIAVSCAKEANARRLAILHFPRSHVKEVLDEAKHLTDIPVLYPELLKTYTI